MSLKKTERKKGRMKDIKNKRKNERQKRKAQQEMKDGRKNLEKRQIASVSNFFPIIFGLLPFYEGFGSVIFLFDVLMTSHICVMS